MSPAPDVRELRRYHCGVSGGGFTRNQSDRSPNRPAKSPPDSETEAAEPRSATVTTRPPQSPNPLRWTTSTDCSEPSAGKAASIDETGTLACQLWYGDRVSPSSGTAGNVPPAVH